MLLIVSNSTDATADFLQDKIRKGGYPCFRLNTDEFPLKPSFSLEWSMRGLEGQLTGEFETLDLKNVRAVWWRRPQDYARQATEMVHDERLRDFVQKQIRDSVEIICGTLSLNEHILWVNHPHRNETANAKHVQMKVAHTLGLNIPDTILSNKPDLLREFFRRHKGEVVFKATRRPAFYAGEDMFGFYTTRVDEEDLRDNRSLQIAPVFLQQLVRKQFELRVTVIGEQVFAARIDSQKYAGGSLDWRLIPAKPGLWQVHTLNLEVEEQCRQLVKKLGLHFGAIDLAVTPDDRLVFFEINPSGQWAWLEIEAEIPMSDAFLDLFFEGQVAQKAP